MNGEAGGWSWAFLDTVWDDLRERWLTYVFVAIAAGGAATAGTAIQGTPEAAVLQTLERIELQLGALEAAVAQEETLNQCLDYSFDRPCVPWGE